MSQQYEGNVRYFTAGEDLAKYRRVKFNSSAVVMYADATDRDWVGVTQYAVSSGDRVGVKLRTGSGTHKVTAAGTFAVAALLYSADDGKVDDADTGSVQFQALEAATAANDIVEALKLEIGDTIY